MEKQFVGFKVANNSYCFDIDFVKEVVRVSQITWMPHASGFVKGIINLRGVIIPVISLKKKLELESDEMNLEEYKLIILNINNLLIGLIVDDFMYVFSVEANKIQKVDMSGDVKISKDLIDGVIRLEENVFLILNIKNLLDTEEKRFIDKEIVESEKVIS
ncbi:MAG: chemotaxis protein CheW [Brevinematia bacterium]